MGKPLIIRRTPATKAADYTCLELRRLLPEFGWKILGQGEYNITYAHSAYPDKVLKLQYPNHEAIDGAGYWSNLCRNQRLNDHMPIIDGMAYTYDRYRIVLGERLLPMPGNDLLRKYINQSQLYFPPDSESLYNWVKTQSVGLHNLLKLIYSVAKPNDQCEFSLDIREDNVMMRGDTYVIADPYAYCHDRYGIAYLNYQEPDEFDSEKVFDIIQKTVKLPEQIAA